MKKYYVNKKKQANGDHEVHEVTCRYLPKLENRIYLGEFFNCWEAAAEAKKFYHQVNGCKTCSYECHTQ